MTSPISSSSASHDGVHRAGAAEGDERVVARVDALLDGDRPHRVGHVRVDDREHPLGERGRRPSPSSPRPSASASLRRALVELHPAAEEVARVEPAEEEVRVGDGRLRAAAPVAGGAGIGAGALRPDAQAARLEPGERAAAGADRVDVDERHQDGSPSSSVSVETVGRPSTIRLRSNDVPPMSTQSRFGPAGRPRERGAADRAADRAGEQRLDRLLGAPSRAVVMPPFDCITCSVARDARARRARSRACRR